MAEDLVPVLIVGGGVVGLSASLFLAKQGVPSLLVERHPGTSIHPRARGVNGRTMELMRQLGLEDAVRAASAKLASSVGVYSGKNLVQVLDEKGDGGFFLRRARRKGFRGQASSQSPTGACRCTQDELEPVLLEAAKARGVDARFSTECLHVEQSATGVTARLKSRVTGEEQTVRAQYLIAADGARSPIRERLGVAQTGSGVLAHQLNLYFRADLSALVKGREFSMCFVELGERRGLFTSINNTDLWVLHVSYFPERGERPEDFPGERCVALIREAAGVPSLEVTLKGALPWQSAVRVASAFQHGRIFLAGDAAHVMPPWGGFGANTGIQDAHNLAWKLAEVLAGRARPALLETYDVERRPVGQAVAGIAGGFSDERGLMKRPSGFGVFGMVWQMRRVLPYLTMGYGYASSAVVLEPGAPPGPGTRDLRGRPGTRAPHVWLQRGDARISSLDLFGGGYVLLAGEAGAAWCAAARSVSGELGMRVEPFQLGRELQSADGGCARAFGIKASGASLIRPDGIVAWRARQSAAHPDSELRRVLRQLSGHASGPVDAEGAAPLAAGSALA